ncbi:Co-chaperone Hsc20 [Xylaria sp. FL1042]|nr:Co-chaperone Hsc20 [Xylaria sp. FL1042]
MRSSSLFPARQMRRVCAFCRQQQQQQQQQQQEHIATTRSLHTSSTRQQSGASNSPLTSSHSRSYRLNQSSPATTRQRPFSQSVAFRNGSSTTTSPTTTTTQEQQSKPISSSTTNDTTSDDKPKTPQTHYDFFPETLPAGPPPHGPFEIDLRALRREFLALQAGAHPDLHPSHMKARAQATSARINEAYKTLSHPLLRAQYILSLVHGVDVAGDETGKVEDPELLMLVLETRECIEEADEEGDLVGLREENEGRIEACLGRLGELFARAGEDGEDALSQARDEVVRLRYWVNIRESIDNWEKGKPVVLEH